MIRPYRADDAGPVLALNAACVPEVGPMDEAKLASLIDWAGYVRVVEDDGRIIAFLIALGEGTPYESPNYSWFSQRHDAFAYIDRVAVSESERGAGWGPALYRDVEAWALSEGKPVLCAEVNTEPPNPRSLRFHDLFGFDMVEQFEPYGTPDYRVGLMEKRL